MEADDSRANVESEQIVAAVRDAVGDEIDLMIEVHGRLSVGCAIEMGRRLIPYRPAWYEEPVTPHSLDFLNEVRHALPFPIATASALHARGIRETDRAASLRRCSNGLSPLRRAVVARRSRRWHKLRTCESRSLFDRPGGSLRRVALRLGNAQCFDPRKLRRYDIPWRNDFVGGWNPCERGSFNADGSGAGIELNIEACAAHPPQKNPFPSLWMTVG